MSPMDASIVPAPLRILVVDDHPIVVSGIRAMLSHEKDIQITSANSGERAIDLYTKENPDVVILDINLPGLSGFETARRLLEMDPDAALLVFSMNDDPIFAARAIESGAKGYITKNDDPNDFIAAIKIIASGGVFLLPKLARRLAYYKSAGATNPLESLNPREIEILRLLGKGKSIPEIAHTLDVSAKTIANTCSLMKNKLGARTPMDLVRIALEHDLV